MVPVPTIPIDTGSYYFSEVQITVDPADNEQSVTLPANVRRVRITNLSAAGLRFSWLTGKVADPTATPSDNFEVGPVQTWDSGEVYLSGADILYYASTLRGGKFNIYYEFGY
jgi:hypothetical protein